MKNKHFKLSASSAVLVGLALFSSLAAAQAVQFSSEQKAATAPGSNGVVAACSAIPTTVQSIPCTGGKAGAITQGRTGSCDYNTGYQWSMTEWEDQAQNCGGPIAPTSSGTGFVSGGANGTTAVATGTSNDGSSSGSTTLPASPTTLSGYYAMSPADQRAYLTSLGFPKDHPLTPTVRPVDSVGTATFCMSVPKVVAGYACASPSVPSNYTVGTYSITFETAACTKKAGVALADSSSSSCSPPAVAPVVVTQPSNPHVEGGTFCTGFGLIGWWADTGVQYVKEANSSSCGYVPPVQADYEGGTFCNLTTLTGWWALTGVQYVKLENAPACSKTPLPAPVPEPVPAPVADPCAVPGVCPVDFGGGYEGDPPADAPPGDAPPGDSGDSA